MKKLLTILVLFVAQALAADRKTFHAEYETLIREAKTPEAKQLWSFEYRLLCYAEKDELEQHFSTQDDIDQFEAWMLAKTYSAEYLGACLDMDLPKKDQRRWVIRCWVGRGAEEATLVFVDSRSGRVTCKGYPTIRRPSEFLAQYRARWKTPNNS